MRVSHRGLLEKLAVDLEVSVAEQTLFANKNIGLWPANYWHEFAKGSAPGPSCYSNIPG